MRVLLATSRYPYPILNGEDHRNFYFSRYLSPRHEIHLLTYAPSREVPETRDFFRSVHLVPERVQPPRPRGLERLRRTLSPDELFGEDPAFRARLAELTRDNSFDLIWMPSWELVPYTRSAPGVPTVVDVMDDGMLEYVREIPRARNPVELGVTLKRLVVNYRFERKYFRDVSVCVFVSERDDAMFRRICPGTRTAVVANGVDAEFYSRMPEPEDFPSVIFEGNMRFRPNVDAVEYIARDILPLIRARRPETRFWVVGKDPAPAVLRLEGDGIVVTGTVDDVRPYLSKATVFVCAMRRGAGIKNKILQAWSMSLPVVATTIASGGLRVEPERNIILRDGAGPIADAVLALFDDHDRRVAVGTAGRRTVQEHHDWEAQVRLLEQAFRDAVAEQTPGPGGDRTSRA